MNGKHYLSMNLDLSTGADDNYDSHIPSLYERFFFL